MKYLLLTICVTLALATIAAGQTYEAKGKQTPVRPTGVRPPPPLSEGKQTEGAIPRGLRGGNPLQMLNPLAPPQYGTYAQGVILEPYSWKWNGIKLYEIVW